MLQKRGLQLVARDANNFTLPEYPGLIVKDSYWRWPERDLAGNAIDFCMRVLQLQFLSKAAQKIFNEVGNVLQSFAQRRQVDDERTEPVALKPELRPAPAHRATDSTSSGGG